MDTPYDLIFELSNKAVQDLQRRTLSASLNATSWLETPLHRTIEQRQANMEVNIWWKEPEIKLGKDETHLTVEINGGARQGLTGHILRLNGPIKIGRKLEMTSTKGGRPYVRMKQPKSSDLHLGKLQVINERASKGMKIGKLDLTREMTNIRPSLTNLLMQPISRLPLSWLPRSFPLRSAERARPQDISFLKGETHIFEKSASLQLGYYFHQAPALPANPVSVFPVDTSCNAAIALSERGINFLLEDLCHRQLAKGTIQDPRRGTVEWQWESLNAQFNGGTVFLSGVLWQQGYRGGIQAQLRCFLDADGGLICAPLPANIDPLTLELIRASWSALMLRFLRARAPQNDVKQHPEKLYQCFQIPDSELVVETTARKLLLEEGRILLLYTIPATTEAFTLDASLQKPSIAIRQREIATQPTAKSPIIVHLEAELQEESYPPYDYLWRIEDSTQIESSNTSGIDISCSPKYPHSGDGPQALTIVHLKVIDMGGQVSETQALALYYPYTYNSAVPPSRSVPRKARKKLSMTAVLVRIMIVLAILSLLTFLAPPIRSWIASTQPPETPTPQIQVPTVQASITSTTTQTVRSFCVSKETDTNPDVSQPTAFVVKGGKNCSLVPNRISCTRDDATHIVSSILIAVDLVEQDKEKPTAFTIRLAFQTNANTPLTLSEIVVVNNSITWAWQKIKTPTILLSPDASSGQGISLDLQPLRTNPDTPTNTAPIHLNGHWQCPSA